MYPTLMVVRDLGQTERSLRLRGFRIFSVDSAEEARRTAADLRGVEVASPVVLSDVSQSSAQAMLLKFVEETRLQLILLASRDNISSVLLSRMKRVVKDPVIIPFERDDPEYLKAMVEAEEDEISIEEIVRNCPSRGEFFYRVGASRVPVKDKLIELLLGGAK